jgi:hypothetical protein
MILLKIIGCAIWLACGYAGYRIRCYSMIYHFYLKYRIDARKDSKLKEILDDAKKQMPLMIVMGAWNLLVVIVFNLIFGKKSVWYFEPPKDE